jgi:transposase
MLGIDVSKDTLHCTLLEPTTRRPVWSRTYANTPQGISRLLKATTPECPWALEPTGSYSTTVVKHAREAQRDVRLAEPRRAKRFLQSIQNRAKCDRLDSAGLGLYALCHELPAYPLKSPLVEQLDQLLKARKGLALSLQQLQAQSRALPHASAALQPAIDALQPAIDALQPAIDALQPAIDALQAQQHQIEQKIEVLSCATSSTSSTPTPLAFVRELQKVPGIGPVTAATLASRLAGRSFARSDAFVAYCGLDIAIKQSGQKRGNGGLTKQGDAELRRLL